jgi:NitT/TauT family transport system substrate-binding protein
MRIFPSLFIAIAIAVSGFGAQAAVTKTKLALNWKPEPQFGGFYAAQVGGHFKKNELDVEILQGGAGTPVVQMVAAKQMDFGIVSADEVVISRSRGGDVVALFAAYQTNPQGIMTHAERNFASLADVYKNDGTLAIQKGLPYAMYLEKKFAGAKVKVVPYAGGIANFLTDKTFSQQCFVTSEPLAAAKQNAKTKTFLIADEGYNPYTTVLVTRADVLKNKPELVKAMVAAVRAGWRDYLDKPEATNKLMGDLNKSMDAATFIESAKAQKPLIETEETKKIGLGAMTDERWSALSKQLVDLKVINKAPETKSLYTNL